MVTVKVSPTAVSGSENAILELIAARDSKPSTGLKTAAAVRSSAAAAFTNDVRMFFMYSLLSRYCPGAARRADDVPDDAGALLADEDCCVPVPAGVICTFVAEDPDDPADGPPLLPDAAAGVPYEPGSIPGPYELPEDPGPEEDIDPTPAEYVGPLACLTILIVYVLLVSFLAVTTMLIVLDADERITCPVPSTAAPVSYG